MSSETISSNKPVSAGVLNRHTLRLISGLVLFAFVVFHLLNHSLGLISLEAMEAFRDVRSGAVRSWLVTALLIICAITHTALGLEKAVMRKINALTVRDIVQIASGLLIPILLARHIIGTRIAHEMFAINDNYEYAMWAMWPGEAWTQAALILLVWVHSCIGIYMWLRFKVWFGYVKHVLFAVAAVLPVLAYSGFFVAGRKFHEADVASYANPYQPEQAETIFWLMDIAVYTSILLVVCVAGVKIAQAIAQKRKPKIEVTYNHSFTATGQKGLTLLEMSKEASVPHASICGGRARCSTCRVQVLSGAEYLAPAEETEIKALRRANVNDDSVRLACQIRPLDNLSVVQLVPASAPTTRSIRTSRFDHGVEKEVTVLFTDIRGFTSLSEGQLPYDVVFMLNQYMGAMSEAITANNGYVDKFMGDGMMAIFGMESEPEQGALDALKAAADISKAVSALNMVNEGNSDRHINIGIGVHSGEVILGRIGASQHHSAGDRVTALGDTVNTASRLEALSKTLAKELVVSRRSFELAQVDVSGLAFEPHSIRGREDKLDCASFKPASDIANLLRNA